MTPERIEEFFKRYYFTDNEAESIAMRDLALDGLRLRHAITYALSLIEIEGNLVKAREYLTAVEDSIVLVDKETK